MLQGVHHAGLTVSDVRKSIDFYCEVLGAKLLYTRFSQEGWDVEGVSRAVGVPGAVLESAKLAVGGDIVELIQYTPAGKLYDGRNNDVGIRHLAFQVADVQEAYEELSSKGVRFNSPPHEIKQEGPQKGSRFCYFSDPDGIQLELIEMPDYPPA